MLLNSSENEKLFAKLVPVSMKDVYTSQSRLNHLFLAMEWQEASAGAYNRKVLSISLTDNNDPFFLYNLHLSEEDFQMLKASQDLLINFSSFPQHIIDYIEKCLMEEKNPQPKFLLVFTINEKLANVAAPSQLDIVETNQFKHLIHLSLKFIAATESAVKQYLASCFRQLKDEKKQLQRNLAGMERELKDKLSACQRTLHDKNQDMEKLRNEVNDELTKKDNKHHKELQDERNHLINKYEEQIKKKEKEFIAKECSFRTDIQQFKTKVEVLESLSRELQNKNYTHESTIEELRSKVLSFEEETRRLNENLQSYKHKCDHLQSEIREKQSHMRQQGEIISDLQQELKSKEQHILILKAQIESESKKNTSLENELENIKFRFEVCEKTREALEKEKEKLNEVIIGLQEKSKDLTKEEKAKCHLISKYKKSIEEKENALLDNKQEIAKLNISLETKNAELKKLTDSNFDLQKKQKDLGIELRRQEQTLKEMIPVVKWLQRQLTNNCIIKPYIEPPHLNPSAAAQQRLAEIRLKSPENSSPAIQKNVTTKSVSFSMSDILGKNSKNRNITSLQAKQLYPISFPRKDWY